MNKITIRVFAVKNYRTEVLINDKFAYQTGLHPQVEMGNIRRIIDLLGIENVEITGVKERVYDNT